MKQLLLLLLVFPLFANAQYRPDILCNDFEQRTLSFGSDSDGEVISTLIRHEPLEGVNRALLYVHGYNDYFFQREMAERFTDSLWNFYAVDLRDYGRSIIEGQQPFDIRNLDDYFQDIDAAIDIMQEEGADEIILMGHSTGGLITSLYCEKNKSKVDGLILNSPFFDMNMGWFVESIALPVVSFIGGFAPGMVVLQGNDEISNYAKSLLSKYHGEWEFDTSLKVSHSMPMTAGWLRAINVGHKQVQAGLKIECPVLLLYSDKSIYGDTWSDDYLTGDSVLDVADIAKYGENIGKDVTKVEITDGLHDLILSRKAVREEVYTTIFSWLRKHK